MPNKNHSPLQPADVAMFALVLIWGANLAVIKSALTEIPALAFTALRFTGGSVLSLLLAWRIERNLRIQREDWGLIFLLGVIGNLLYQSLFISGLARTRASNSSLILATVPIFVALISTATRSERLNAWNWLGVLVSFGGISLLITGGGKGIALGSQTLVGDLLTLAATVAWAAYTVLLKRALVHNGVLTTTAWIMASSAPLMVLAAVPQLLTLDWYSISAASWLGLVYSFVFAIAIGYAIWNVGVQRLGSARTSLYSYITPLVSVTVAWLLLGEKMQLLQAAGAIGILVGVVLGRYRPTPPTAHA